MLTPVGAGLRPSMRASSERARSTSKSLKSDSIARSVIGLNSCEGMLGMDHPGDFGYPGTYHHPLALHPTAEAIGAM